MKSLLFLLGMFAFAACSTVQPNIMDRQVQLNKKEDRYVASVEPNVFVAVSTTGYWSCSNISVPEHIVYARSRTEMDMQATSAAKEKCMEAGYDVCEVINATTVVLPTKGADHGCFVKATVKGGHTPGHCSSR